MDNAISEKRVLAALGTVLDPELGRDLVSLGMIEDLSISGPDVRFRLVLTTPACPLRSQIEQEARSAVLAVPGVDRVSIEVGAKVRSVHSPTQASVPGIRNVVAVASGKGGVGKSTVSVNLAVSLAESGARVGLLDADITGPNIPMMMNAHGKPSKSNDKMAPLESYGVKVMSIGFFLDGDTPVVWRGSLVSKAIEQFLRDVDWGETDYLIVDLPPGTGDAPLTLARSLPLTGVVIVTTPQDVALLDARRALSMFRALKVPVLGIVENMSFYVCPGCGEHADIFGSGGGEDASRILGVPFLGRVPLDPRIRIGGDKGLPVIKGAPHSAEAKALKEVSYNVAARISVLNQTSSETEEVPETCLPSARNESASVGG